MSETGDNRKVIHLGMPCTGEMTMGASVGFHRSTRRHRVELLALSGSLPTSNFNGLWCWAMNAARKGNRVDYFAMIHSDIEPGEFWIDGLIDELEAKSLDVLGVVAPIKDPLGLTSIAIAHPSGDPWRIQQRLTMKEVHRLPETFTSEDVGGPLLLNTGLWVCRFDMSWAPKVFFTVNDRIMIRPDGDYVAQNEPEDWFSSRVYHELGLRVGCTRKVPLAHRGTMAFGTAEPWGTYEFDRAWAEKSVLDERPPASWFPHHAAGWLTEEEGAELARLAAGKVVLEIGSYCGRSTICLAQKAVSVGAVDPFDGRGTAQVGDTLRTFLKNVEGFGHSIRIHRGVSSEILPHLPPIYDLVFIDGSHDRESVAEDAALASAVLKPGGLLVFHDYGSREDPGVTAAVDDLISGGGSLLSRCGSLAIVRPPAAVEVCNG